jgi:excinuclease UvrABC ATPase subunit
MEWLDEIGAVFNSFPKFATNRKKIQINENKLWIKRIDHNNKNIESVLETMLKIPNLNICVDGPSGSGKSSLVNYIFNKNKLKSIFVQVGTQMNWRDFCSLVISSDDDNSENSLSAKIAISITGVLPKVSGEFSFGLKISHQTNTIC